MHGMDFISRYIENVNRDLYERRLHTLHIFGMIDRRAHNIILDIQGISMEDCGPVERRTFATTFFWKQSHDLAEAVNATFKECL